MCGVNPQLAFVGFAVKQAKFTFAFAWRFSIALKTYLKTAILLSKLLLAAILLR